MAKKRYFILKKITFRTCGLFDYKKKKMNEHQDWTRHPLHSDHTHYHCAKPDYVWGEQFIILVLQKCLLCERNLFDKRNWLYDEAVDNEFNTYCFQCVVTPQQSVCILFQSTSKVIQSSHFRCLSCINLNAKFFLHFCIAMCRNIKKNWPRTIMLLTTCQANRLQHFPSDQTWVSNMQLTGFILFQDRRANPLDHWGRAFPMY